VESIADLHHTQLAREFATGESSRRRFVPISPPQNHVLAEARG